MKNIFQVPKGERLIVATTPRFPLEIDGPAPGYIEYAGRRETRFHARKRYVENLLRPYRWLNTSSYDLQGDQAYELNNAEAFYPQDGKLTGYGVDDLIDYSDSSGPGRRAIHQYSQKDFHPAQVLNDMVGEMSSGTQATNERSTLAMFLVSNPQFRDRVLDLINLHIDTPIVPDVREDGQVHIIRLGTHQAFQSICKRMWAQNEHDQEDVLVPSIMEIPHTGKPQNITLGELFPGFNLWNLDDTYYPVYKWNRMNRVNGGHMEVRVDYTDISKSVLVIRNVKKQETK